MKLKKLAVTALLSIVGLVLLVSGVVFMNRDRLFQLAQERLDGLLAEQGIFITYQTTGFSWAKGLQLEDVSVFRDAEKTLKEANLSNVRIHFPARALRTGRAEVDVHAEAAKLTVFPDPEEPGEASDLVVEPLDFELSFEPGTLNASLAGPFQGIGWDLAADLVLPVEEEEAPAKDPAAEEEPEEPEVVESVIDFGPMREAAEALKFYRDAGFGSEVQARLTGNLSDESEQRLDLEMETKAFPSQASDLTGSVSAVISEDGSVELPGVEIGDGRGAVTLVGAWDRDAKSVMIESFESTLDLVAILQDVPQGEVQGVLKQLTVETVPKLAGSGRWDASDPSKSALGGSLSGVNVVWDPDDNDLKPIRISEGRAAWALKDGLLTVSEIAAQGAGGRLAGTASARPFDSSMPWTVNAVLEDIALVELANDLGDGAQPGLLTARFEGNGGKEVSALNGQGSIQIIDGAFLKLPIVGSLLDKIGQVASIGTKRQGDQLRASFDISDGILRADDMIVDVSAVTVKGQGNLALATQETDFKASANLAGLLGDVTTPVGKVLEIEGSGPVGAIEWRFKNLQAVSVLQKALKGDVAGAEGVLGVAEKDMEALEQAGKDAVREIKDLFKNLKPGDGEEE